MKFSDLVICSDLDGTLINEQNKVPKENIEAIEYFRANGGKVMLATGRLPDAVYEAIEGVTLDFPCICHNGGSVYDLAKKEYIEINPLDDGVVEVVDEIVRLFPSVGIEVMNKEGICVARQNFATDRHIEYELVGNAFSDGVRAANKPWIKILFAENAEEIDMVKESFLSSPYHEKYNMLKTHRWYYEIFNKNASKGMALMKFCDIYGINLKNVIAVGDNENDISMLEAAGTAVAVANAHDEVKAHADIITCSNEEGAIADLISRL